MAFELRDYQVAIVEQVRTLIRSGVRSVLIQAPTGSGKTALTAHILGGSAAKGNRSWFICHRREILQQTSSTFGAVGISHGLIAAGFPIEPLPLVQIASIQTLQRRYTRLTPPRVLVWDEAHHARAASWEAVHAAVPDAIHLGLTATPQRLDGRGLGTWFDKMVQGPAVADLIDQGWLSKYRLFAPPPPAALDTVHIRMADFVTSEASAVMSARTVLGDALAHYQRYANFRPAVVFCCDINHSKRVVQMFQDAGVPAEHVDGETPVEARDAAIRAFEAGTIRVLSNVELFGEGFDLPAIEVAILLRPTHSMALYLQQVGRALRPSPGKPEAIILDHAGNAYRHGLPDEPRGWSLDDRLRTAKSETAGPAIQLCPACLCAIPRDATECKYCGHVIIRHGRATVETVDGELTEIDVERARREAKRQQRKAETLAELIELGKLRKYRNPYAWAKHVFKARQQRKLAPAPDIIGGEPWPRAAVQE